MNLFINTNSDASTSSVTSLIDNNTVAIPRLFFGDAIPLSITFTNGFGDHAEWVSEDIKVTAGIGVLATNTLYAFNDSFTKKNNVFYGTLVISTENLADAIIGLDNLTAIFEIQVERSNGQSFTVFQSSVEIYNQLLSFTNIRPGITELDTDGDFVADVYDAFPNNNLYSSDFDNDLREDQNDAEPPNPLIQDDQDQDGIDDSVDDDFVDSDNDGTPNSQDDAPNNPDVQIDQDQDGIDDTIDPSFVDSDNDGYVDEVDEFINDPTEHQDTDGDNKGDNSDYFVDNPNYTQSQEELDSYQYDIHKSVALGDIVKFRQTVTRTVVGDESIANIFMQNEYHIVSYVYSNSFDILFDGEQYRFYFTERDTVLDVVNPSDQLTELDQDSDTVPDSTDYFFLNSNYTQTQQELDSYVFDTYKTEQAGDIIKILQEFTIGTNNYTYSKDSYFYIIGIGSTNIQITRPDQTNVVNIPITNRTTTWEIVNPSDQITPNPDTDGDGKLNEEDYFSSNSDYTQSKQELDSYVDDQYKDIAVGDIVKILEAFTASNTTQTQTYDFQVGEYHIVSFVGSSTIRVEAGDGKFVLNTNGRQTKWIVVNPSDQITPNPNLDTDSDGVIDTQDYFSNNSNYTQTQAELDEYEFDYHKQVEAGDIVKSLLEFFVNQNGGLTVPANTYLIVSSVPSEDRIIFTYNNVTVEIGERTQRWEIVNPSDQITQPPPDYSLPIEDGALYQWFDFSNESSVTKDTENKVSRVEELSKTINNSTLTINNLDWDFVQNNNSEQPTYSGTINNLNALSLEDDTSNMQALDLVTKRFETGEASATATIELVDGTETISQRDKLVKIDTTEDYAGYYQLTLDGLEYYDTGTLSGSIWYKRLYKLDGTVDNLQTYVLAKTISSSASCRFGIYSKLNVNYGYEYGSVYYSCDATPESVNILQDADGTNRYYASMGSVDSYNFEIFLVGKHNANSIGGTNHYFDSGGIEDAPASSTNPKHRILVRSSQSNTVIQALSRENIDGYTKSYNLTEITELGVGETFILNFRNGENSRVRINGGKNEKTGSLNPIATLDQINIGNWFSDTTHQMNGLIGEFIIIYKHCTDTETDSIEGYLSQKWGIQNKLPTDHPFYNG